MKIYLVEDDDTLREELALLLQKYGYQCQMAADFATVAQDILAAAPDLVLLDINLPYRDGYEVCRAVRRASAVPIIILTSRATDLDELMSLKLGADDFVTKPYNAQVLVARIERLLQRTAAPTTVLRHNGLALDLGRGTATANGQTVELTRNELGVLRLLLLHPGNVLPRDAIMEELWQSEQFVDENTLNVVITRLRKKLAALGLPDYLQTRRGMGYCV